MQNGFLRSTKYLSRYFLLSMGQITMVFCIILIFNFFMNENILGPAFITIITLSPLIVSANIYTVFTKNIIGFSITRSNLFLSSYVGKAIFSIVGVVLLVIFLAISHLYLPITSYINLFVISICIGISGDFYGLIIHRFSTVGYVIYIFTCACFGGLVGFSAVYFNTIENLNIISNPLLIIIALSLGVVLSFVNWLLIQKLEIKN